MCVVPVRADPFPVPLPIKTSGSVPGAASFAFRHACNRQYRESLQRSGAALMKDEGWSTFPADSRRSADEERRQAEAKSLTDGNVALPPPRVAACLIGELRTGIDPRVATLLRRSLLAVRSDLFAVVSTSVKGNAMELDVSKPGRSARIRNILRPLRWVESDEPDDARGRCTMSMQLSKLDSCRRMVQDHEQRQAHTYDWILRARPDVVFPPPPATWHRHLRHDTVYESRNSNDPVMLIPRAALDTVACGWRSIDRCDEDHKQDLYLEAILRAGFGVNDAEFVGAVFVRPPGWPDALSNSTRQANLWRPNTGNGVTLSEAVVERIESYWNDKKRSVLNWSIIYGNQSRARPLQRLGYDCMREV